MYQIDNSTAAAARPASTAPGTPGYYTDGNPATGNAATILPAEWLNAVQDELLNILKAAGIAPNKAQFNQLAQALQGGTVSYAPDTGAANAYIVALASAPAALADGFTVAFKAKNTNTAASTLNLNGLGAQPIVGQAKQPLQGNEILAGSIVRVVWNSTPGQWVILTNPGGAQQLGPGSYGTTGAQFDNTTQIATTAFVKRAQGAYAGAMGLNASTILSPANAGYLYNLTNPAGCAYTLPVSSAVPIGTQIGFRNTSSGVQTIQRQGADVLSINGTNLVGININPGENLDCVYVGGATWLLSGAGALVGAAGLAASIAGNGYQRLPSGFYIQWGYATANSSGVAAVTFPISFPNYFFIGTATPTAASATPYCAMVGASSKSAVTLYVTTGGGTPLAGGIGWMAIGN